MPTVFVRAAEVVLGRTRDTGITDTTISKHVLTVSAEDSSTLRVRDHLVVCRTMREHHTVTGSVAGVDEPEEVEAPGRSESWRRLGGDDH